MVPPASYTGAASPQLAPLGTSGTPLGAYPMNEATPTKNAIPTMKFSSADHIRNQIRELSKPQPRAFTLTAALYLLEPLESEQDVFLMSRSYLQNWLVWAYHQKVAKTESARVEEAIRLAAERMGLTTPRLNMKYNNPGPVDVGVLAVEDNRLLLRPHVVVAVQNEQAQALDVPASLRRVKSLPEDVDKHTGEEDPANSEDASNGGSGYLYESMDFKGDQIRCCAVPYLFHEVCFHLFVLWCFVHGLIG